MRAVLPVVLLASCRTPAPTATVEAPGAEAPRADGPTEGPPAEAVDTNCEPDAPIAGDATGVIAEDGMWFVDAQGHRIAAARPFDNGPDYFVQGRARIVEGGKTGYIDRAGKIVVPPRFDFAAPFCEGLAPVCMGCKEVTKGEHAELVGGQWGYIDRAGTVVIPIAYDRASGFSGGEASVEKSGATLRIDRSGRPLPQ